MRASARVLVVLGTIQLAGCGEAAVAVDAPVLDAAVADAVVPDAAVDAVPVRDRIIAGERVGPIELGMRWGDLRADLGDPPAQPVVVTRVGYVRWPALGLEAVLTSPAESTLTDDAIVIGAGTTGGDLVGAIHPGETRADVVAALGAPPEDYGGRAYYPTGLVVAYGDDDLADLVAVVAPYTLAPTPPPMLPAHTTMPAGGLDHPLPAGAVIDMHLHPGTYATMAPNGKAFIAGNVPAFFRAYAPPLLDALGDPYGAHVGVRAQTTLAGVDHAVLLAVYTQHTTGYLTNEALEALLTDPRNLAADGLPWAWGMVSINLDDWLADIPGERLAAMRSYLVERPDLFIGIKLAHTHQGVAFDDARFQGIYQLAAETGAPVLLHTGFTPFPGAWTDPASYDPEHLEAVVTAYDGAHGQPRVDFVLSHVGQGDARSVLHALDLAAAHANVWLELSALGRPWTIDADGVPSTSTAPQYRMVLQTILDRGLVARTLFASDGPQYSGAVRGYVETIRDGLATAGFDDAQIAAVLGGNFARLYLTR